jgi:hypothetical protein
VFAYIIFENISMIHGNPSLKTIPLDEKYMYAGMNIRKERQ